MAVSVCANCGNQYSACGSCGTKTVCKNCKREELVAVKRANLTNGRCLYWINDNFVGEYTIEQGEAMMKVHVGGRIELKGDVNV